LDVRRDFEAKLSDALITGIGAISDAGLSKESAKLQSLQVKQQLGIQALSLANSSAQSALSLFR
jgi:flagellin